MAGEPKVIVRLTQLDGKLPNLALMRLSAVHRRRGDEVHFSRSPYRGLMEPAYDLVYGSAIFSFSADRVSRLKAEFPGAIVGGTGSGSDVNVEDVERAASDDAVDYGAYPDFTASLGFTQRGCRMKCKFCVVPGKEGDPRSAGTINDIWRGPGHPKHLHLLDNDFFGQPRKEWEARIEEIVTGDFKVCLNQGINIRLIGEAEAAALARIRYSDDEFKTRRLYTAWDNLGDEERFFRGVDLLERHGIPPRHLMAYMLIGYDRRETWARVFHRLNRMKERGVLPFPMVYGDRWRRLPLGGYNGRVAHKPLWQFQKWVIRRRYHLEPFEEFNNAAFRPTGRGYRDRDQPELGL